MSKDTVDIASQLGARLPRLLAQLATDAAQLETALTNPGNLDAAELQRGRRAANAVAKALQDMGDFGDNHPQ